MTTDTPEVETLQPYYIAEGIPYAPVRRVDIKGKRHYYATDTEELVVLPSVTTILRATMPMPSHLLKWWCNLGYDAAKRFMKERAAYGTLLHLCCAEFLRNGSFDLDDVPERIAIYTSNHNIQFNVHQWRYDLQQDMIAFAAMCAERNVELIGVEVPIASSSLGYAGTSDILCRMNFERKRVVALIDVKSGRNADSLEYMLQVTAYQLLWNLSPAGNHSCVTHIFLWHPSAWTTKPASVLKNYSEHVAQLQLHWFTLTEAYAQQQELATFTDQEDMKIQAFGQLKLGMLPDNNFQHVSTLQLLQANHKQERSTILKGAIDVDTF